ncbi:MAG: CpXC domain-containing protein [Gemmataceae bacterium]|nr:CpXC domain-containing protein [Gemmataceae bacterium]
MSLFRPVSVPCPSCGASVEFNTVFSLNADRRPDLRVAVLNGSFQRQACPQCNTEFRLDPELTYLDVGRGQWIGVFPVAKLDQWKELEAQTQAMFNKAYGDKASAAAREIGAGLKPRLVFGWSALREKLVAVEQGLDDVILELTKAAMVRGLDEPPVDAGTELRLVAAEGDSLAVAWLVSANEEVKEMLRVPRSLYDEIAADTTGWSALHESLSAGPFVDVTRFLLPEGAAA